jgi:16S rRNA (uracil1498-N3)-methyltransferase
LSIPLIFVQKSEKEEATIDPSDAYHLKEVLRFEEGDKIFISDGERKFLAVIVSLTRDGGKVRKVKEVETPSLRGEILLFQALLKGKKMDFLVQKATELGVDYFYPTIFKRSVARPKTGKVERWERIVKEACKQSGRHYLMEVIPPLHLKEALERAGDCEALICFAEEEKGVDLSEHIKRGSRVALFFGPEGGFGEDELEMIKKAGGKIASLGPMILRAETATIAGVSLVSYLLGRMQV